MSHYTKTRAAGYYNDLLIGDDEDFHKLIRKYSIAPPDDIANYKGVNLGDILVGHGAADPKLAASTRSENIKRNRIPSTHKIAHIDLRKKARQTVGAGQEGDMIYFDATYAVTANYVPVYFLPWDTSGAAIRLTIPAAPPNKGPSHPIDAANPYLFFTAAINGCSIFFRGTPQSPTIFHCGGSTGRTDLNDQAEFWQAVMDEFVQLDDAKVGRQAKLGPLSPNSVDKRDYIKTPGVTTSFKSAASGITMQDNTTQRAKNYKRQLQAKHALGKLSIESVSPWACVLGRRDDHGDWTFYIQENATITYHQISKNPINRIRGIHSASYSVVRPLIYREVFPHGAAHVTVKAGLPSIQW